MAKGRSSLFVVPPAVAVSFELRLGEAFSRLEAEDVGARVDILICGGKRQ